MNLYHFTSVYYLPSILRAGLTRGDVPLGLTASVNGVWLTKEGRKYRQVYNRTSRIIHPGGQSYLVDKAEIRITVDTERLPFLFKWEEVVAKLEIDPLFAKFLNSAGNADGGLWFVSFATVPPSAFVKIERDASGRGEWREIQDAAGVPQLEVRSVSSWELETGQRIQRIPVETILPRLK